MNQLDDLQTILDRVASGSQTEADIAALRHVLLVGGERNVVQIGKYNIHIEHGENIQIGDHIYQGPSAEAIRQTIGEMLAELRLSIGKPFQVPPLPPYFVPRPEVTEELKRRLLAENTTAGALVVSAIHGLGGIGKSTLAAALAYDLEVQARFPDGILWATLGQQPDVLSRQAGWIQALGDSNFHPTTTDAAATHLRTLLHDKACLLVVDDAWEPGHVAPLLAGGGHSRVLVTTRDALIAKAVGATLYDVDVLTPEQAIALLSGRLGRELAPEEHGAAAAVAAEVGYLPLALELAAAQVADGVPWTDLLADLQADIARLEALEAPGAEEIADEAIRKRLSLGASLGLSLRRLPARRKHHFAWLGVLPEDTVLAPDMASTLWGLEARAARDTLRHLYDRALLLAGVPRPDGALTYRLHDLLHDLARRLLTVPPAEGGLGLALEQAHAALLERYRTRTEGGLWHTLPDDGYIHAYLAWHMDQAGQWEELYALVATGAENQPWAEARHGAEGSYAGYLCDLDRSWRRAAEEGESDPAAVGRQVRCALIVSSIHSLAGNLPPNLLLALAEHRVPGWTPQVALIYARQMPDLRQRARALASLACLQDKEQAQVSREALETALAVADTGDRARILVDIAPCLQPDLLPQLLQAVRRTYEGQERARLLAALAPWLHGIVRTEVVEEAFSITRNMGAGEDCVLNLVHLAPYLSKEERGEAMREALGSAQGIVDAYSRAHALVVLSPYLLPALLPQALQAARGIANRALRAWAVAQIMRHRPEREQIEALREAVGRVSRIAVGFIQTTALAGLANRLAELGLPGEAFEAAARITDEHGRCQALQEVAPSLPEEQRLQAVRESLKIAREIGAGWLRASALADLVPHLPEEEQLQVLVEAQGACRSIGDQDDRAWLLANLASDMPQGKRTEALETTLRGARTIRGQTQHVMALANLACHLPDDERLKVLKEALRIARRTGYEGLRARILLSLIPFLPEGMRTQVLREAFQSARAIPVEYLRDRALGGLALEFSEWMEPGEALEAARGIRDTSFRDSTFAALAVRLAALGYPGAAAQAIGEISEAWSRAFALMNVADYMPTWTREHTLRALQSVYALGDETLHGMALALPTLYLNLPAEEKSQALAAAWEAAMRIKPEYFRALTLTCLLCHLSGEERIRAFGELLRVTHAIAEGEVRADVLLRLAPFTPEECLGEVLAAAFTIDKQESRHKALAHMVPGWTKRACQDRRAAYAPWPETLRRLASRTREDLLSDLRALEPVLFALGGEEAVAETFRAIQDVGRWWP